MEVLECGGSNTFQTGIAFFMLWFLLPGQTVRIFSMAADVDWCKNSAL
jgi:hypothetical protein